MSREERITTVLSKAFNPEVFEIVNESHLHSGPRTESHYKVFLVSTGFEGLSRVERQQSVYALLDDEFKSGLHSISLRLKTPLEIENKPQSFETSDCKHKIN